MLERNELPFIHSNDPTLEPELIAALLAEERLRGIRSTLAQPAQLATLKLEGTALLEYKL